MTEETILDLQSVDKSAVSVGIEPPKPLSETPMVGELTELALAVSEPSLPENEWLMYFGVPVEKLSAVDEEKITPATHGRLKVPLSKLMANTDIRETDIYVSLVVVDVVDECTVRASDMMITGSREIFLRITDPSAMNGLRVEVLKGTCLLVLNPVVTGVRAATIPSLKNCMNIGRLRNGLSVCSNEKCDKPVFVDRDGHCCFQHASKKAGLRLSVVGGDHAGGSSVEKEVKKKPQKPVMDSAEKEMLREANRKSELIARKKTAVLLANRRSEGSGVNKNPFFGHMRGSDLMELGDVEESVEDDREKLARFEKLKRKRELIERRRTEMAEKPILPEPPVEPIVLQKSPDRQKSLKNQFDELVLVERGLN